MQSGPFLTAALAVGAISALSAAPHVTSGEVAAKRLLATTQHAALAQGSVQAQVSGTSGGGGFVETVVCDLRSGYADISLKRTHGTGKVRLVGGALYAKGASTALETLLNLPATPPKQLVDRWFVVPPSLPTYSAAAAGLTLPTLLDDAMPALAGGSARTQVRLANGVHLNGIATTRLQVTVSGIGATVQATLYVSTQHSHLPIEFISTVGGTVISEIRFDKWRVPVRLTKPSHPQRPNRSELLK